MRLPDVNLRKEEDIKLKIEAVTQGGGVEEQKNRNDVETPNKLKMHLVKKIWGIIPVRLQGPLAGFILAIGMCYATAQFDIPIIGSFYKKFGQKAYYAAIEDEKSKNDELTKINSDLRNDIKKLENSKCELVIEGFVSDRKGKKIKGANVKINKFQQGSTTDSNGRYNIKIPGFYLRQINMSVFASHYTYGSGEINIPITGIYETAPDLILDFNEK